MTSGPQLRDIHLPSEPGWWPPTLPVLLLVAVALVLVATALTWLWRQAARRRESQRLARYFDEQVASAGSDSERLQRASICLRRAVARCRPDAVAVTGDAWLALLDDDATQDFTRGAGRLLADGPFQRELHSVDVSAALALARARFIRLGARGHA